ncbi:SURF1 family protein [Jannaschia sp. R86511]|uniref:SURF1 family protein n=1 Tax=Jannaschia sp. R86511 TaxID=3093853 RepID=UPI0036D3C401
MARTLLTWRWAASTALLLAAVVTMVLLGNWQWERSVPVPTEAAVDLAEVRPADLPEVTTVSREAGDGALVPEGASGELVRVEGRWRADRSTLVAQRELDGRDGLWLVTAVELADGGLVPVVRGWVPAGTTAADVPAPAGGTVQVVGWVQQSEPLDIPVPVVQPDGVVPLLSTADLANRWPEQLVPGFVVVAPTPGQADAAGVVVLPQPPTELTEARDWRNLAYSAQWFVFAAFAVVLWWRMLRDDVARREAAAEAAVRARPSDRPVPSERSTA